jgi:hypothetical protein
VLGENLTGAVSGAIEAEFGLGVDERPAAWPAFATWDTVTRMTTTVSVARKKPKNLTVCGLRAE